MINCMTKYKSLLKKLSCYILLGYSLFCSYQIVLVNGNEAAIETRNANDMDMLRNSLDLFKKDTGSYPTTSQGFAALLKKPIEPPAPKKYNRFAYLKSIPIDGWNNAFDYQYLGKHGIGVVVIRSFGEDGKPGGYGSNRDQLLIFEDKDL